MALNQFKEHILELPAEKKSAVSGACYQPRHGNGYGSCGSADTTSDPNNCPAKGYCNYDCEECYTYTPGSREKDKATEGTPSVQVTQAAEKNSFLCKKMKLAVTPDSIYITQCIDCNFRKDDILSVFKNEVPCK